MSLILSGIKSDISNRSNRTITSYTVTSTAVNASDVFSVAASSDGLIVIAASLTSGRIYTSTNQGVNYTLRRTFSPFSVLNICCSSDGSKVFIPVGGDPLYYSTDFGVTYTASNVSGGGISICCSSDGSIVYFTNNDAYKSTDTGATFTIASPGGVVASVTCSLDGSKVYYLTSQGIYYSSDTGTTYTLVSSITGDSGATIDCSGDARVVVAACDPTYNIYVSVDYGASFTNRFLVGVNISPCVSLTGSVMAVLISNVLYFSNDYGLTWINTTRTSTTTQNMVITGNEKFIFYGNGSGAVNRVNLSIDPINNLGSIQLTASSVARGSLSTVSVPSTVISTTTAATTAKASSLCVQGPPVAGTNHTITNLYALGVTGSTSIFNGPFSINSIVAAPVVSGGSGSINFSGCSGTFLTSTGNVTLGGNTSSIVLGSGTTPTTSFSVAAGCTGTFDLSNSSGSFKFTSGPMYRSVRTLTGTTTISASTGSHFIVATSGTFTITLPGIQNSSTNGLEYFIANSGSGTITLSVANTGTERFNGGTSTTISMSQHNRTHVIAFTNVANSLYSWYNF